MTGGRAVVLGLAGRNFAAGMSGGLAFVLDREKLFRERCNLEMIALEEVVDKEDVDWLHDILTEFVEKTGSTLALPLFLLFFSSFFSSPRSSHMQLLKGDVFNH